MKRIVSIFLLCVIFPFILLTPLSSNALDIQGTEYTTPSFLPIDVDFSQYDYYFVTVSGSAESPSYRIYLFKDNNKSGRLYVSAALSASSTRFYNEPRTAFGVTTDYEISFSSFSRTSGTWGSVSVTTSSSAIVNFAFDGYSDYTSSSKYVIGCNADIYDYSGNLVRKGDYDNLISYFRGGLNGASDKSEKPTEPTTSGGSGGGSSIDLDFFSNSFKDILNALDAIATSFESMTISVSTAIIENTLEEIKTRLSNINNSIPFNFEQFTNVFTDHMKEIKLDLFDFKKAFLEFASVGGEIKNLAGLFSEIHISISNLRKGLETVIDTVMSDYYDFADDIKSNVSSIRMIVNDFTGKFDTIISELKNINFNVSSDNLSKPFLLGLANLQLSIDSLIDDINIEFGNIRSSVSADFTRLIAVIESEFRTTDNILSQILGAVNSLPDKFGELLKYLFIPQEDHFTHLVDDINKHFGFVHQIIKLGDVLVNESDFDDFQPSYSIGFDSDTYGHFKTEIIDFSVVAPYVDIIKGINTGIILYFFIRRTRRKLPDIINGTGGD